MACLSAVIIQQANMIQPITKTPIPT